MAAEAGLGATDVASVRAGLVFIEDETAGTGAGAEEEEEVSLKNLEGVEGPP